MFNNEYRKISMYISTEHFIPDFSIKITCFTINKIIDYWFVIHKRQKKSYETYILYNYK